MQVVDKTEIFASKQINFRPHFAFLGTKLRKKPEITSIISCLQLHLYNFIIYLKDKFTSSRKLFFAILQPFMYNACFFSI